MITEEMMAAAAAEMNEAMLLSLPDPEDCHHTFSAKFEKKMKRVIYRANHPLQIRILQKVASVILVLFLCFATIMAISPTVRASVFGWIREQYESFIAYYFVDSVYKESQNTEYYIDCLDTEYTLVFYSIEDNIHYQIYEDINGTCLDFTYATKYIRNIFYIEEDKYEVRPVLINGKSGDLYVSIAGTEKNSVIWWDEESKIMFYLAANIEPELLISLAEKTNRK